MDLGMHRAGFETRWFCEVDPFRRELLAQHWPGVPIYPDLTTLDPSDLEPIAVLIGGTPCQDLSINGRRAGLEGSESRLFWDYMRLRNHLGIEWCVWENVAGALSSHCGLDFAQVLGAFVGATVDVPTGGWPSAGVATGPWGGCVWRVLDAQYFGVPQRRRRVFVVGHLGGPCPPEVLFEARGGHVRPPTRRQSWKEVGPFACASVAGTLDKAAGGVDGNDGHAGHLVCTTVDPNGAGEVDGVARWVDDPPPDRHRESACGDGVVAPVAEWVGRRLYAVQSTTVTSASGVSPLIV